VNARIADSISEEAARIAELCQPLSLRAASIGWAEVVDALESLPATLKAVRAREHLTVRDVEALTGVPFNSVSRFERGHDLYLSNALQLARWLAKQGGEPS
jgi:hypothetical protein